MVEGVALPIAEAFIGVTVLVAAMVALFSYLQHRLGHRLTRFLLRHRRSGPLLGALAGVIPGCGGAVVVVPLFARSQVSFGTLVAALVATMGDASFVLIAADPRLALTIHLTLFVVGVLSGAVVDAIGYSPRPAPIEASGAGGRRPAGADQGSARAAARTGRTGDGVAVPDPGPNRGPADVIPLSAGLGLLARVEPVVAVAPVPVCRVLRVAGRLQPAVLAFWAFIVVGATITVPVLLQLWEPLRLPRPVDGLDPFLSVGLGGTGVAGLLLLRERRRGDEQRRSSGSAAVLHDAAVESARLTVWLAVAFLGLQGLSNVGPGLVDALPLVGLAGVVLGALVGLVPGCAPQIVLTGLYVTGSVPIPTLLANALSQDGDALLPLMLMDRRSAVVASLVTTAPGLVGGAALLLLGVGR